jgi:hypothetical protein
VTLVTLKKLFLVALCLLSLAGIGVSPPKLTKNPFFKLSGVKPNRQIKDKLIKELIDIVAYQAA